jgi:adenylate kinase
MLGAPGAGKGTQAALLAERLKLAHVASGDLFRHHMRERTPLGVKAARYIERGALVPDELTVRLVEDRLSQSDAAEGAILDGFPRTRPQAEALDSMLARRGGRVAGALFIDIERDVLQRRLSGRWICRESEEHVYHERARPPKVAGRCDIDGAELYQRKDDEPETIRARLDKQLPPMYEVVDYYADAGVLASVDGDRAVSEVTEALLRAIAQAGAAELARAPSGSK